LSVSGGERPRLCQGPIAVRALGIGSRPRTPDISATLGNWTASPPLSSLSAADTRVSANDAASVEASRDRKHGFAAPPTVSSGCTAPTSTWPRSGRPNNVGSS